MPCFYCLCICYPASRFSLNFLGFLHRSRGHLQRKSSTSSFPMCISFLVFSHWLGNPVPCGVPHRKSRGPGLFPTCRTNHLVSFIINDAHCRFFTNTLSRSSYTFYFKLSEFFLSWMQNFVTLLFPIDIIINFVILCDAQGWTWGRAHTRETPCTTPHLYWLFMSVRPLASIIPWINFTWSWCFVFLFIRVCVCVYSLF